MPSELDTSAWTGEGSFTQLVIDRLRELDGVRLVRVENDMIRGDMDGYWDPDRQCVAHTQFYGFVSGTTIEGTFRTTYSAPFIETSGRWFVKKTTATLPSGNRS